MYRFSVGAVLLLATYGCDSTPASPPPPALEPSLSQSAVALERTSTSQVTATSTVSTVPSDVTATATWRSDNTEVATVSVGLILAVGPGTATITAGHAGQAKTITVTVRRRTYLTGEVTVRQAAFTARMSLSPAGAVVEPGNRNLTVRTVTGPDSVTATS